ncbi:MAG: cytochrome c biogenesis CcdA family protein [Austwickia sp.]|nr:cytochrome c biogenesis protein CcdA [Austwickia sp.]MCO5308770.1 cytochrome c biogenesis CcdA family protein [Austwickia sp.]
MPLEVSTTLVDGNLLLAGLIAAAAGIVSFASPCVLPLVPGFLGYVTGLSGGGARDGYAVAPGRRRVLTGAALFVLGFSAVFLSGILLATALGMALREHYRAVSIVGGVVVIALALVFLGVGAQGSWAPRWRPAVGLAGAPLLGIVFAVGWAPCMGPTLGVIMTLATTTGGGSVGRGAALGAAYCLGLGLPFLLVAAGFSWATRASGWLRRHHRGLQLFGGALLLAVGVLLVTGLWDTVVFWLQAHLIGGYVTPL